MVHLANLLPLGASIYFLDLSQNKGIDDSCLPITAFLPFLTHMDLSETSITIDGLRNYASIAIPLKRLPYTQLKVPLDCKSYLEEATRSRFYAFSINEPYLIIKVRVAQFWLLPPY